MSETEIITVSPEVINTTTTAQGITQAQNAIENGMELAIVLGVLAFSLLFLIIYYVMLGKVFKKAGLAWWKAWVPFLNNWKLFEIGGQKGFWSIFLYIPALNIIGLVMMIIATYNINLKFGHGVGMTILAALLSPIWLCMLALGKDQWNDSLGAPSLANAETAKAQPTEANVPSAEIVVPQQPTEINVPPADVAVPQAPVAPQPEDTNDQQQQPPTSFVNQ